MDKQKSLCLAMIQVNMVNVTYVDKQGMYLWVNMGEHKFTRVTQHNYVVNTYIDTQGMDKQGYPCVVVYPYYNRFLGLITV